MRSAQLATLFIALCNLHLTTAWFQPKSGTTWQIILEPVSLTTTNLNLGVSVYDIDMDTDQAVIDQLHANNKKVICYMSIGSYEPNRSDSDTLHSVPGDIGNNLTSTDPDDTNFPEEQWLNIKSDHIIQLMKARIDVAANKNCDGIDPDNVDAFSNKGGGFNPPLTTDDSVAYLTTLSNYAHSKNLGFGLKNAGAIAKTVEPLLDWVVNEECMDFNDCGQYRPFIDNATISKPVFHIEYQKGQTDPKRLQAFCYDPLVSGFSTIIKPKADKIPETTIPCPPQDPQTPQSPNRLLAARRPRRN